MLVGLKGFVIEFYIILIVFVIRIVIGSLNGNFFVILDGNFIIKCIDFK